MILHDDSQFCFNFFPSKPVVAESSRDQVSSDGGLLPVHQFG
jgi:hypothetical protein